MRIQIPRNPDDLIKLATAVNKAHTDAGANSPVKDIQGIDQLGTLVQTADKNNNDAKDLAKEAEECTEQRDIALGKDTTTPGTALFIVTAVRDVLAAKYKGAEHTLGEWGFTVDSSPQATPEQKAALKAAKAAVKTAKNQKAA